MNPDKPKQREVGPASLLHNMSCRPNTVIRHEAPPGRTYGRGLVCQLPKLSGSCTALRWLSALDGRRRRLQRDNAEAELRRRINEHARNLDLPPAAVLHAVVREGDTDCDDLLTVLTVAAKSAGHVYLRDKEPNLVRLTSGRRVVVIIPPARSQS